VIREEQAVQINLAEGNQRARVAPGSGQMGSQTDWFWLPFPLDSSSQSS